MSNFTYKPTNSLYKIAKLVKNTDLAIVQGGQGAGKTVAIFMLLIDLHNRTFKETTVASAQLSKLKGTAILDMIMCSLMSLIRLPYRILQTLQQEQRKLYVITIQMQDFFFTTYKQKVIL